MLCLPAGENTKLKSIINAYLILTNYMKISLLPNELGPLFVKLTSALRVSSYPRLMTSALLRYKLAYVCHDK
jgi:hypothetical protein